MDYQNSSRFSLRQVTNCVSADVKIFTVFVKTELITQQMQQKQDELSSHPVQSKEHRRSVDSQETGRYSVTEGKERREHEWRNELKYSKRNGLNVSLRGLHTSLTVVTDTVFLLCKNIRVNALNPDIITAAAAWLSRTRNRIDSPNPQTSRRNLEGVR